MPIPAGSKVVLLDAQDQEILTIINNADTAEAERIIRGLSKWLMENEPTLNYYIDAPFDLAIRMFKEPSTN